MAEYSTGFVPCKQLKRTIDLEGRINQLPDKTLVQILSLLTLNEAGRTSVLSHRWKDLWKSITCLNFDASEALIKLQLSGSKAMPRILRPARSSYLTWVNQVLRSHRSPTLDEFRVNFELDSSSSNDIDEWIKCVIPRRVKKLDIDLSTLFGREPYSLSEDLYRYCTSLSNLSNIKCLTSLSLSHVNVSGEFVEYFIANCPHLEKLAVSFSSHLLNLTVAGSSLPLKDLELSGCHWLKSLELQAPNLVKFKYYGHGTNVHIGNNPLLTELFIGCLINPRLTYALDTFANLLSQLETLEFSTFLEPDRDMPQIPELTNLKHLIVDVTFVSVTLMGFTNLIVAAPSLKKFTLQLVAANSERIEKRRAPKHLVQPHQCLRDVEVLGFVGGFPEKEILGYLFMNAVNLERVIIDPYHPFTKILPPKSAEHLKKVQKRAAKLKKRLPPRAKLIIL